MDYDPQEIVYKLISRVCNWENEGVKVVMEYDLKNVDLRVGDYIIVGSCVENEEPISLSAVDYVRYVAIEISIRTTQGRGRVREIARKIREHIREKDNWEVDGIILLNFRISSQRDRSDYERGIYTQDIEFEWFTIEKKEY